MVRCTCISIAALGMGLGACDQVPSAVPGPAAQVSAAATAPVLTKAFYDDSTYTVRAEYFDPMPPRSCCFHEVILWRRRVGDREFHKIAESRTPGVVVDRQFDLWGAQDFEYRVEVAGYGARRFSAISAPVRTGVLPAPGELAGALEDGRLVLHWSDNSLREAEFVVERRYLGVWATVAHTLTNVNEVAIDPPQDSVRFRVLSRAQWAPQAGLPLIFRTSRSGPEFMYYHFPPPAAAPSIVSGTFTPAGYAVHVAFTYAGADSVTFVLERRTLADAPNAREWTQVPVAVASPGLFIDRSFDVSSTYTHEYRVRACNRSTCRASDSVRVQTLPSGSPYGLRATYSTAGVLLQWSDGSTGEQSFLIQHRTPSTRFRNVVTTAANRTSYLDPAPVVGEENIYWITALVPGDTRFRASGGSSTTILLTLSPPVVNGASFSYPDYAVRLSFSHYEPPSASSYRLERRLVGAAAWEEVTHAVQSGKVITDQSFRVTSQNDFEYRLSACVPVTCSRPSWPVRVTTPRLRAPENVAAVLTSTAVQVTWTDVTSGEDAFVVERASSPTGPWTIVQVTSAGSTSFADYNPVRGATNYYRVRPRAPGVPAPRPGTLSATASVAVP